MRGGLSTASAAEDPEHGKKKSKDTEEGGVVLEDIGDVRRLGGDPSLSDQPFSCEVVVCRHGSISLDKELWPEAPSRPFRRHSLPTRKTVENPLVRRALDSSMGGGVPMRLQAIIRTTWESPNG